MTRIAFWDVSGGHGTPTLVYHLAHMLTDQGRRPLILDFDPSSHLTAMCVTDDRLADLWWTGPEARTIAGCVRLLMSSSVYPEPQIEELRAGLGILAGNVALTFFEGAFAAAWSSTEALEARMGSSVLHRATSLAEQAHAADIVLVALGPGLGAINRAALFAADLIVTPLAPDLTSVGGLLVLGRTLSSWRADWQNCTRRPEASHARSPVGGGSRSTVLITHRKVTRGGGPNRRRSGPHLFANSSNEFRLL
jgi:cellulose biosynthesis protein BcsQ